MINTTAPGGPMVMPKTGNSADKVKEFHDGKLKEQGWENESAVQMPQGASLSDKKAGRPLSVNILSGDETTIQLFIGQEKNNWRSAETVVRPTPRSAEFIARTDNNRLDV
jgi:hypothetical protein